MVFCKPIPEEIEIIIIIKPNVIDKIDIFIIGADIVFLYGCDLIILAAINDSNPTLNEN
jgi:hypothetical protein|tara:strand:+ start:92 stop:268 length:177 start_codon:yes stop_codon:yes gene_type:complete